MLTAQAWRPSLGPRQRHACGGLVRVVSHPTTWVTRVHLFTNKMLYFNYNL